MQDSINIIPPKIQISRYQSAWSKKKNQFVPGVVAQDADLYHELTKIKDGGYKDLIIQLRHIAEPGEKKNFKQEKLTSLTISAVCRTPRDESNIVSHSGALCIDIDASHNNHITDWAALRDTLADRFPGCVACGLSASGKGIFLIVRIKPELHKDTFFSIQYDLEHKMGILIDDAPKNPVSLRFVSYDPDCYINYNYENIPIVYPSDEYLLHKSEVEKKAADVRNRERPATSKNDVDVFKNAVDFTEHAKSLVFKQGTGTLLITTIAGYCNARGMDKQTCLDHFLAHYGSDAYYTKDIIEDRIFDIYERYTDQFGTIPINSGNQVIEISFFDTIRTKKGLQYSVNRTRFMNMLYSSGIGLYRPDGKTYVYTQRTCHYFEEVTIEDIKKVCQQHLDGLQEIYDCGATRNELKEFFYKGIDSYFSKNLLEFLPRFVPDMLKDTREEAYLPFRNGVVKITATGGELLPYDQIGKYVWKDAIISHEISIDEIVANCEWSRFYACVNGADSPDNLTEEQTNNFFYLCALTGYLIHKYKDPARPYAVILAEATETEDKGGGTGKGLLCKGIEKVASTCFIAGKTFDPVARFAWQRMQLHNTVAVVDDVPKGFQFQGMYNAITDGLTVERKNQQEIYISYEDSPKIVIISNYVISNAGNHAERRQKVFEFAPFFSPSYTPEKHFGHLLLKDWDYLEWNRFYNFMISCTANYLKEGIPNIERSEMLKHREIVQKHSQEFNTWFFDEYMKNGYADWQSTTKLHTEFLEFAGCEKQDYSQKKFMVAMSSVCRLFGLHRRDERKDVDGKKINGVWVEKKTDGIK